MACCGVFSTASASISSIARRAVPRHTVATPTARKLKYGNTVTGPSMPGVTPMGHTVRRTGRKAPATENSCELLARRPAACHVSWIVTSARGYTARRGPTGVSVPPMTHDACVTALPQPQRPVTR